MEASAATERKYRRSTGDILRGKRKCKQIGKVPTLYCAKDGAREKSNAKAWATRQSSGRPFPTRSDPNPGGTKDED